MATQVYKPARVAYGRLETRLNALLSVAVLVVSMGGDSGEGGVRHPPNNLSGRASVGLSPLAAATPWNLIFRSGKVRSVCLSFCLFVCAACRITQYCKISLISRFH